MEPRPSPDCQAQGELRMHKTRLANLLNDRHPMVRLAREIDWHGFDEYFGTYYSGGKGRPTTSTRLMVSLHYLKYTHDLSDEAVVMGWVENPYWQYLSGMEFFCHEPPIDPSSMSRWRRRVGEAGSEELLRQTIETGLKLKVIKPSELRRVNVDTTVQEKHIRYPTDPRLYDRMRQRLVAAARREDVKLRQSYVRVGKELLALAKRLHRQRRHDKGKLYSVHAPEVECISKGKAHKRYEFGCKVALAVSSKGGWVLAAQALEGNPYEGHTLQDTMDRILSITGIEPEHAYVDTGYRGHDYEGGCEIHVGRRRRGAIAGSVWRWMRRRATIEPSIGHLKEHRRMERCRLKGTLGDEVNSALSAAAMTFSKLLAGLGAVLSLLLARVVGVLAP